MTLVRLDNISKGYGALSVLEDLSWQIEEGRRIGLVGPNGCGKTTLLKSITGELEPDRGQVYRTRGTEIGYLEQEAAFLSSERSVLEEALEGSEELMQLQSDLGEMERRISSEEPNDRLMEEYGRSLAQYEHGGGYELETKAKTVLFGLGFQEEDLSAQVEPLSGGEKSRLALAKLLMAPNNLLLLDEPTNHLDLEAVEWLERFLGTYPGAVVVVSHDRFFLDRAVHEIAELADRRLARYVGGYTAYAAEKARRIERQQRMYQRQQEDIRRKEEFIQRNIAGQKTKQAQRVRKLLDRVERIERPRRERRISLRFAEGRRGGDQALEIKALSKDYDGTVLLRDLSLIVRHQDRMGVIGPNGAGKTTLLRILTGQETAESGSFRFGHGVEVGYYDQTRMDLNEGETVLEEVWSVTPRRTMGEMRNFLGRFLFSGDDVFQKVGSLSGGEQSRVALAKLILSPVNLLILDEPTNHLDVPSRMVLEQALSEYGGTLLVVSHDRYFLNALARRILLLESGVWRLYEGDYSYFERQREEERTQTARSGAMSRGRPKGQEYRRKKSRERARERKRRRFEEIEDEIMGIEDELVQIDDLLGQPEVASDWSQIHPLNQKQEELRHKMDELYEEWAALEREI